MADVDCGLVGTKTDLICKKNTRVRNVVQLIIPHFIVAVTVDLSFIYLTRECLL